MNTLSHACYDPNMDDLLVTSELMRRRNENLLTYARFRVNNPYIAPKFKWYKKLWWKIRRKHIPSEGGLWFDGIPMHATASNHYHIDHIDMPKSLESYSLLWYDNKDVWWDDWEHIDFYGFILAHRKNIEYRQHLAWHHLSLAIEKAMATMPKTWLMSGTSPL